MKNIPYENAKSGERARQEIINMLQLYGAESVGFMDEFETHTLLLVFCYRGRNIQLRASASGWAAMFLQAHPYHDRRRRTRQEYEHAALKQGIVAINSILRDWIKGQLTAIETGILTFEHVFLPYMITDNGQSVSERLDDIGLPLLSSGEATSG